jgi:hypothetical protein
MDLNFRNFKMQIGSQQIEWDEILREWQICIYIFERIKNWVRCLAFLIEGTEMEFLMWDWAMRRLEIGGFGCSQWKLQLDGVSSAFGIVRRFINRYCNGNGMLWRKLEGECNIRGYWWRSKVKWEWELIGGLPTDHSNLIDGEEFPRAYIVIGPFCFEIMTINHSG